MDELACSNEPKAGHAASRLAETSIDGFNAMGMALRSAYTPWKAEEGSRVAPRDEHRTDCGLTSKDKVLYFADNEEMAEARDGRIWDVDLKDPDAPEIIERHRADFQKNLGFK